MAYPYITQQDLEDRVSARVLREVLDDENVGLASADSVTRILKDASAKVAGYLRGTYDLTTVASVLPEEVVRLTLDVAVAYLAQRHPEVMRVDWTPLMEQADKELKALRRGDTRLDIEGPPEPPANTGGAVGEGTEPGGVIAYDATRTTFQDGFSDY